MSDQRSGPYILGRAGARDHSSDSASGFKLRAVDTAGLLSFLEFSLEEWQSGPDLHVHSDSDESFYVLSGEMEFQVGEERHVVGPGEFVWVPRGTAHTFANAGESPARALTVATPGGLERFFAEQAQYLASCVGELDPSVLAEIRRRHGGARLGPPIRSQHAPREVE
ncbi:MAG: cupin domain-containing protein [Pseudonocardiaceae bacterium]